MVQRTGNQVGVRRGEARQHAERAAGIDLKFTMLPVKGLTLSTLASWLLGNAEKTARAAAKLFEIRLKLKSLASRFQALVFHRKEFVG